jgi:hypothetical protein
VEAAIHPLLWGRWYTDAAALALHLLRKPHRKNRLVALLAPLVVLLVQLLFQTSATPSLPKQRNVIDAVYLTFGRLTFGIITSFKAEGASLRPRLGSPWGWYWYLAVPPVFQGSESPAWATLFSLLAEVGLRLKCQPARAKAPDMMAKRIYVNQA